MHRISLEHQCVGFRIGEIVDRDQFKAAIRPFEDRSGYEAANPPEAVDRNFHCHSRFSLPSSKSCAHLGCDRVGCEAEIFIELFRRSRCATAVAPAAKTDKSGITFPAKGRSRLRAAEHTPELQSRMRQPYAV